MDKRLPLEGVTVIELATVVAAPVTGRLLSDFGARVIKIETPPDGDLLRSSAGAYYFPEEEDNSPFFDAFNAGKKLIALNLKEPEGRELFEKLLADADVFLTNVRMRSLKKMELGYETLHERFPELIYAHFSGYGLNGPEAEAPGFDVTAFWMRSGAMLDTLLPGSYPLRPTYAMGDMATASAFFAGILMALYARKCGGHGTMVSSSLLNAGIWYNTAFVMNAQPQYGRTFPLERHDPHDPFSDYYQCADGEWVGVIEKVYQKDRFVFADVFDMPELVSDPALESLEAMRRSGRLSEVSGKVEAKMRTKSSAEWLAILSKRDVPAERIRHFREVSKDPQAWANGYLEKVSYPDGAETAIPTPPICFSDYGRKSFEKRGPVGMDTEEVLGSLGCDRERIESLRKRGVVK
ncbi:MAG: CoA transferase [Lachnospiraceae bacterium]|nr:CoA transferase [Lachnospiraceae bacterium]